MHPRANHYSRYGTEVQKDYADDAVEIPAEALLAKDSEGRITVVDKYWNRILTAIRSALKKLGFISDTVDGRLVFVAPETVAGKPVVVEPNTTGDMDVHLLLNAYDRGTQMPIVRWVNEGKLRYANNEEIPAFNDTSGLRLPRVYFQKQGSSRKIATERNLVKYREGKNRVLFSKTKRMASGPIVLMSFVRLAHKRAG